MSLLNLIRKAVVVADKVTKPLQGTVTHSPWIGQDGDGTAHYGSPTTYQAIVEVRDVPKHTAEGDTRVDVCICSIPSTDTTEWCCGPNRTDRPTR